MIGHNGRWAYYNEHDPFAAAWLRELMKDDLIAPGEVDERSIEDVTPDELRSFRQCHFFAGIGVWSLAARRAGWRDDEALWTGSCPCQPFSAAGKGGGFADERHLWPAFHYLIEQCSPPLVVGEQVTGADGDTWLDLVSADLDASGYGFGAAETCAAGFGAPHERSRNYWMAHTDGRQSEQLEGAGSGTDDATSGRAYGRAAGRGVAYGLADSERARLEGQRGDEPRGGAEPSVGPAEDGSATASSAPLRLADAPRSRRSRGARGHDLANGGGSTQPRRLRSPIGLADSFDNGRGQHGRRVGEAPREGQGDLPDGSQRLRLDPADGVAASGLGNPDDEGGGAVAGVCGRAGAEPSGGGGPVGLADDASGRRGEEHPIARWRAIGERAQGGSAGLGLGGGDRRPGPVNGLWGAVDWILCRDQPVPKWRPIEPGTFPLADVGTFRNRVGLLRGAGNAVTLAQAEEFLVAIRRVLAL